MKTNRILCISLLCAALAGNILFTSCSKEEKKKDPCARGLEGYQSPSADNECKV